MNFNIVNMVAAVPIFLACSLLTARTELPSEPEMRTEDFRTLESPPVSLVKPIADARERLLDRNDPDIANRVFSSDGGGGG